MKSKNPTEFHEIRRFETADWIVVGLCALLLVSVLAFNVNFSRLLGVIR